MNAFLHYVKNCFIAEFFGKNIIVIAMLLVFNAKKHHWCFDTPKKSQYNRFLFFWHAFCIIN